jgi:hypothetical protein
MLTMRSSISEYYHVEFEKDGIQWMRDHTPDYLLNQHADIQCSDTAYQYELSSIKAVYVSS